MVQQAEQVVKDEGLKRITDLDLRILESLYEYRALNIEQLRKLHKLTENYSYRKMRILRISGYVRNRPIRGYQKGKKNQGKYFRITNAGLNVLREHGVLPDKRVVRIEVTEEYIPYLLATNDIMVNLKGYGWELTDSRKIKASMGINRNDLIHGMIQNPKTGSNDYGIYIFLETVSIQIIEKMLREIKNYTLKESNYLSDYILFKRGQEGIRELINQIMSEGNSDVLSRVSSLKLLPYVYGKLYLRAFDEEENVLEYAIEQESGLSFKRRFKHSELNPKYSGLDTVVLHDGEEKYFVNLLDNDLKKIYEIRQYRKEYYETDGRKVLVYVMDQLREIHEELLKDVHHVEYLEGNANVMNHLLGIAANEI